MSITPQQAFEAVRVLWQDVTHIERQGKDFVLPCNTIWRTTIDWGDLTQYPPPEPPKWRPATVEDAIRALKGETVKCRVRDLLPSFTSDAQPMTLVGFHNGRWVVDSCGHLQRWNFCEVQE